MYWQSTLKYLLSNVSYTRHHSPCTCTNIQFYRLVFVNSCCNIDGNIIKWSINIKIWINFFYVVSLKFKIFTFKRLNTLNVKAKTKINAIIKKLKGQYFYWLDIFVNETGQKLFFI